MRAFSTNTELLPSNWFADHLYRRNFWSFATDFAVLPQNNMLGENHFQLWEVGYAPTILWLHCPCTSCQWSCFNPLHFCISALLQQILPQYCSRTTWQFQTCQDENEMSAKPCERTGLENFQNFQILLPFQWRRKCSFVLLCKRCQVHFGIHFKVTYSHLNIKKPSGICIYSFWGFSIREINRYQNKPENWWTKNWAAQRKNVS